ncbi:MAG TPA: PEP-CTERM sorting domain-containing protein [Bryobacteraceae bacterium]|nr:PEP-CTERM sorting domain-containing protein [Bryobacteraceae bacterium]
MIRKNLAISILGLAMGLAPAWGSTVVYCNQSAACGTNTEAAFETATASLTFESVDLTNGTYAEPGYSNADGITGLDLLGFNNTTTPYSVTVAGGVLEQSISGSNTSIEIELPSNVYALEIMVSVTEGLANPCVELVTSASSFNGTNCNNQLNISSSSDVEFVGVVSTSPIADVFIGSIGAGQPLAISGIELGTESPTPEAGTLLLIGTGLVGMRFMNRRQRRRSLNSEEANSGAAERGAKPRLPLAASI